MTIDKKSRTFITQESHFKLKGGGGSESSNEHTTVCIGNTAFTIVFAIFEFLSKY